MGRQERREGRANIHVEAGSVATLNSELCYARSCAPRRAASVQLSSRSCRVPASGCGILRCPSWFSGGARGAPAHHMGSRVGYCARRGAAGEGERGAARHHGRTIRLSSGCRIRVRVFMWLRCNQSIFGGRPSRARDVGPSTLGNQERGSLNACRLRLRCLGISPRSLRTAMMWRAAPRPNSATPCHPVTRWAM